LKRVHWPLNFNSSGIKKYDGSTNPAEWLEVYQLAIEATGGEFICDGKLPASLPISIGQDVTPRTPHGVSTFLVPPMLAVHQQLHTTFVHSRVDWDLASIVQKKGESLLKFIQLLCNKRNIIPKVDDKSIIMFFKKGLRDSSLIHKLTMKNPRMSEEMLAITNKYALAKETLDTREQKKEKELGYSDQPSSSKGHDKKRKADHSVNIVE
jgi:hypothetical protein